MDINIIRLTSHGTDDTFINGLNDKLKRFSVTLKTDVVNSPVTFVLIESGGTEAKFVKVLPQLQGEILIIGTNANNSLPAILEIDTYLNQRSVPHKLFLDPSLDRLAEQIFNTLLIKIAVKQTKGSRLGVIGKPSDWLISSDVNYYQVKNKFGIDMIDISLDEIFELYDDPNLVLVEPDNIKEMKEKNPFNNQTLKDALRFYSVLKLIISKYKLDGLTIRCFDVVVKRKVTACLALSLLNDEGTTCACEGDVPSLLTMFFAKKLLRQETFMCNPSYLDYDRNIIMFAHCTIPLKMCTSYQFDTHFETDKSIGVKGELKPQIINLLKLSPDLNTLSITVGRIERNLKLPNACRTQIEVSLIDKTIDEFIATHQANHMIISYDNHKNLFLDFLKEFN